MMQRTIPYPLELTTERLIIRSPKESDAAAMREAIIESHEALLPWMPWARELPSADESVENCRKAMAEFEAGHDFRLHLFARETGAFVGASGFHRIDWSVPKAEIGYWVRSSRSGEGLITEAVREITRYLIEDAGMLRVEIRMDARNAKSKAIPERLGFEFEGTLRNERREADGVLSDTCVFAVIP
ncbi:MAG: GNAT family N-acetyltransferase [Bacteroidetes bacterium]|nr:GNAT family N-acetyltransferase [Bacteroidota bacterium]